MSIVTVFGGSGFIGRYIVGKLAKRGWRVRVAVRRPNEAIQLRTAGHVGQVVPVQANIRDDASTARAMEGADAVINLVGILYPTGRQKFETVQLEGAERIARLAAERGIKRFVQLSAIGADADSEIAYAQTKGAAEAAVLKHIPTATILRPSVVFGQEDGFFNRFASLASLLPAIPVFKPDARFQPVYVGDVAEAAVRALESGAAQGQTYELGGPEEITMRETVERVCEHTRRRRFLLNVPDGIARINAWFFEIPNRLFGLEPVITRDQLKMLEIPNIVADDAKGFDALGMVPTGMAAVLPTYLYRYRPQGQYSQPLPQDLELPAPAPQRLPEA